MTFDELEKCWKNELRLVEHCEPNQLKQNAIAAANQAELRATVFEMYVTVVFCLLGFFTLADAIRDGEPWYKFPPALITIGVAAFVYSCRRLRKRQPDFSGSLLEIVDGRLRAVDAHIDRVKAFLWWFVVPITAAVGVNLAFNFADRPLWVWALQPLGMLACWAAMMIHLRSSHIPHRKTLRFIKQQLAHSR